MNFRNWLLGEMPLANYKWNLDNSFDERDKRVVTHPKTFQSLERVLNRSRHKFNILLVSEEWDVGRHEDMYEEQIRQFARANNIPLVGHITFGKSGSSGEPLTAWMILHTLGHAIVTKEYYDGVKHYLTGWNNNKIFGVIPNMSSKLQFASARNNKISQEEELVYEMFAEYLWNGGSIRWKDQKPMQIAQIEKLFSSALDEKVGQIVIDLYSSQD